MKGIYHKLWSSYRIPNYTLCQVWMSNSPIEKNSKSKCNPPHPYINMQVLNTVLYTFHVVLTRKICLKIKGFLNLWSFPLFSLTQCLIQGWYYGKKLDAYHSLRVKIILFFHLFLNLQVLHHNSPVQGVPAQGRNVPWPGSHQVLWHDDSHLWPETTS